MLTLHDREVTKKIVTSQLNLKYLYGITNGKAQIVELLPFSLETRIQFDLNVIYDYLIVISSELISALADFFIHRKFSAFDPHVSDTSCQIRAYHVLYLTKAWQLLHDEYGSIDGRIKSIRNFLDKILQLKEKRLTVKNQSIGEFVEKEQIKFTMSHFEVFLMQSHFLTTYMEISSNLQASFINSQKICDVFGLSKNMVTKIIVSFQKDVSKFSVDFLMSLHSQHDYLQYDEADKGNFIVQDAYGRTTIPAYLGTELILNDIVEQELPIFLIVERRLRDQCVDHIFFKLTPDLQQSSFSINLVAENFEAEQAHFMLHGVVDYYHPNQVETREQYICKIQNHDPREIILANMAHHPQFSSPILVTMKENCFNPEKPVSLRVLKTQQRLDFYKKVAEENGFCRVNPSMFFARHAFCAYPQEFIKKLAKNNVEILN